MQRRNFLHHLLHSGTLALLAGLLPTAASSGAAETGPSLAQLKLIYLDEALATHIQNSRIFSAESVEAFSTWLKQQSQPHAALNARMQNDFENGNTLEIDGWTLAASEALLQLSLLKHSV